ncbi:MAG: hypothetical protein KatS3mg111_3452 [Pirellulaceae bacterium]|nr:MAG: hypothetical protein KatS3mg111_3452 [Pirellulaceae bacterium]
MRAGRARAERARAVDARGRWVHRRTAVKDTLASRWCVDPLPAAGMNDVWAGRDQMIAMPRVQSTRPAADLPREIGCLVARAVDARGRWVHRRTAVRDTLASRWSVGPLPAAGMNDVWAGRDQMIAMPRVQSTRPAADLPREIGCLVARAVDARGRWVQRRTAVRDTLASRWSVGPLPAAGLNDVWAGRDQMIAMPRVQSTRPAADLPAN